MVQAALAHSGTGFSDPELDIAFEKFIALYAADIAIESRPFPGVPTLLSRYKQRGARLAVCTNKRTDLSVQLLNELGMAEYFDAIAGRDTFAACKPDARHLLGSIELAGGDKERAIMVGDSDTDIDAARNTGVPVIGVTFGYSDPPMTNLAPDAMISSYDEFDSAMAQLMPASPRAS